MAVSGAGKDHFINHHMPKPEVVASADDFFMVNGEYRFTPNLLGAAHGACLRKVITELQLRSRVSENIAIPTTHDVLVVNNTNTSLTEIAPYMAAGQAYGADAKILCLRIDPKIAAARNAHGTPLATVEKMAERLEKTLKDLPPWWDVEVLNWDPERSEYRPAP